jgi:hypothetical protein
MVSEGEEVLEPVMSMHPASEKVQKNEDEPVKTTPKAERAKKKKHWLKLLAGFFFFLVVLGVLIWEFRWYQPVLDKYNAASVTLKVKEGDKYELAGAVVKLNGLSYAADDHGKITLTSLVAGSYSLDISKDGYVEKQDSLSLKRGDNDLKIISLTKLPDKLYSVKGFVQDSVSGKPILNVQVTLGSKTVQTDPSGGYSFDGQVAGSLKLVFTKVGYVDKELSVTIDKDDVVTAQVPLVPSGQLIFVSNRSGKRALYSVAYDGSNPRLFVQPKNDGEYFSPFLSPESKHVL